MSLAFGSRQKPLKYLLIGLALALACGLGCDGGPEDAADSSDPLAGFLISGPITEALEQSRQCLAAGTESRDSTVYLAEKLIDAIANPQTRAAAAERFFAIWGNDPGNFLWLDIAFRWSVELQRPELIDSILDRPELNDSSSAIGLYCASRQSKDKGESAALYLRANERIDELPPLQQALLCIKAGRALTASGQAGKALDLMLGSLSAARDLGGSALEARYWWEIARAFRRSGQTPEAVHAFAHAKALFSAANCQDSGLRCQTSLAVLLHEAGQPRYTLRMLKETASQAERLRLPYRRFLALNRLSSYYIDAGEIRYALGFDRQVAEHFVAMQDSAIVPKCYLNIADDYITLGHLDSAYIALQEARRWAEASPQHRRRWSVYTEESDYWLIAGDYHKADSLSSLAACTDSTSRNPEDEVIRLFRLAEHGREMGRPEVSYQALQRLSSLIDSTYMRMPGVDFPFEIELGQARLHLETGELAKADLHLAASREHLSQLPSPDRSTRHWEVRAELARALGDSAGTLDALTKALASAGESKRPELISHQHQALGEALLEAGLVEASLAELQEVGKHLDRDLGYRTLQVQHLLQAMALAAQGRDGEAIELLEKTLAAAGDRIPRDLALRFHIELGHILTGQHQYRDALSAYRKACQLLAESRQARGLSVLRFITADALREAYVSRIRILAKHPELCGTGDPARETLLLRQEMLDLSWGREATRDFTAAAKLTLAILLDEEASYLWLIDGQELVLRLLPGRKAIEDKVATVDRLLRRPKRPRAKQAEQQLADWLLSPLAGRWKAGDILQILPDGALHGFAWAMLPWGNNEVLDHASVVEITGLPSGNEQALSCDLGGGLLAMGYNGDGSGGLPRLSFAEAEAESVAALWPGESTLLVGPAARGDFLSLLRSGHYDAIHLSVHAQVHQGRLDEAYLKLATTDPDAPGLSVRQIAEHRHDLDFVYLSCCEASRGASSRRGPLLDLSRAFLDTGASFVIASSRRVDERATLELTLAFYKALLDGSSPAEALRQAKLHLRNGHSGFKDPYFWTAFLLHSKGH